MLSGQVQMLCDVETHRMCHQTIRNHFISHGIPCDSMWNSTWKYLSGLRPKTILMIAVSDIYAFRTTSSDLWCGDRPCVPSEAISFHLEFQVILCDSKWNSKWRYLCKKALTLYLFRIFRLSVRVRMFWGAETHQMCRYGTTTYKHFWKIWFFISAELILRKWLRSLKSHWVRPNSKPF